jgi:ligand-binding sensor domain-containing protein/serine phosphatase RsbU (regulator of sigma subunit)
MKIFFCYLALFFFNTIVFAQVYPFKTYAIEQGLPQSEIWDMMSDSRGYLWIGTNGGGLTKFNGKTFQTFTKKDGLPNEQVSNLIEDKKGNIWAMTFNGLSYYDGISFKTYDESDGIQVVNSPFANFAVDEQNTLWFLSFAQQNTILYLFENQKFIEAKTKFPILADYFIVRLYANKKCIFINAIHTQTGKTTLFQYQKGQLSTYQNPTIPVANGESLCPFFTHSNGDIWAGIFKFAPNQVVNILKIYKISPQGQATELPCPENVPIFAINRVAEDKFKHVWLPLSNFQGNLNGNAIWKYDLAGKVTTLSEKNGLATVFIVNSVADKDGNIWLGTRGFGLIKYLGETFTAINQSLGMQQEVTRTFYKDKAGVIWIGTVANELYAWNGKELKTYPANIPIGRIMKIEPEENGNLLLATNTGIVRFNQGKFSNVNQEFGIPATVAQVSYLLHTKDDIWWIVTQGTGLYRYDSKTKTTTQYNVANKKLANNGLYSVFEDSKGSIWVNSNAGVHRIEKKGILQNEEEKITLFDRSKGLGESLTQQTTEDKNGNIWVTTFGGGLARFDGTKFISYTKENSDLSSNLIYSITTDANGDIWAGMQGGVAKLEVDAKSEVSKITNYADNQGFTGKETNGAAIYKDDENNMWFGTLKGAYKYNPTFDQPNTNQPIANITAIRLFFKPVKWQEEPYKQYFLEPTKWFIQVPQNLVLPYNENHIAFDLEAVQFDNPDEVEFQWKLEGIDTDWTPAIQKQEAIYPNLPPNTYTFKLRAGLQGNWGETTTYTFTITPPWWQTWWFITLCVLSISAIIYSFIRIRLQAIKERQAELEKLVFEKTAEVRQQNTEILAQTQVLQHANSEIIRQSELLAHKNRDITASITYAKRIQTAMLPTETDIQKTFPDSFVLFQPKDIVSGDFYYFENIIDKNAIEISVLAAIDCTGHGVPGAFMSMIGNDLLNHIILEKEIHSPNLILEELNKGVRKLLKQAENKVRDGMDLSLVTVDKTNKILQFAGAMNPIYYLQNGIFYEIKGTKSPIGGYQDGENVYAMHQIELHTKTTFYLCTDGFQDQFSETGKKFMVRKFRELLLHIHLLQMQAQKATLQHTVSNWLGNGKQIDDILVMGVCVEI